MKLFRSISVALVLAFTAGTALADGAKPAGSGAAAPTLSDADKANIAKWLTFFDSVVDAVIKDKDTCPTMATDINALVDKNQDLIKMANDAVASGKKLDDASQKHMMGSVQRMIPALQKCGQDKTVQAAMMRMTPGKPAKSK